jgi:hypothetical protein
MNYGYHQNSWGFLSDGSEGRRKAEPKTRSARARQKLAKRQRNCPEEISETQGGMEETSDVRLREVEPHSEDSHMLNKEDNKMISGEIMLMQIHFHVLEVEVEEEVE